MAGPAKQVMGEVIRPEMHFEVWHKRRLLLPLKKRYRFKGISNINPKDDSQVTEWVTTRADGQRVLEIEIDERNRTTPTKKNTDGSPIVVGKILNVMRIKLLTRALTSRIEPEIYIVSLLRITQTLCTRTAKR
ncbi:hypothetical protein SPFM6_00062 [Salmonella phage SPFM6]|nr:hypothetical protein SPFM6_00062 [Salmonella phage SPFM6]